MNGRSSKSSVRKKVALFRTVKTRAQISKYDRAFQLLDGLEALQPVLVSADAVTGLLGHTPKFVSRAAILDLPMEI